ncbi:DUF1996 domain-containing protein [Pseudonocardia acaciae]|uniref:DUF1996 domain-containing protein n=1 Tax=Pseudonocardia acaciae TaxID=551276 RepID=UPI0007E8BFD4|nr:DUF1996 domain-containing protein [Pseudonocardia acaciae]
MAPPGRHRLPRPTRLLALIVVALVGAGLVLTTGSALAHDSDGKSSSKADRGSSDDDDRNDDDRRKRDKKKDDDDEFPGRDKAEPPDDDDFVDIRNVRPDDDRPRNERDASTGSFVAHCGTNGNGHRNSDNFMVTPGKRNGAQHVHDYVGNLSTDAFSDDDSLHEAGTTCDRNNKSTFFWPVLRDTRGSGGDENKDGGGRDGNFGRILRPVTADMRFVGNPTRKVNPMPDDLSIITGDAQVKKNGEKNANAQWTCTGFENRITDKYPLCPSGSKIVRILEFPSCWDGKNLDSKDHRAHMAFPDDDGDCKRGFKTIPKLRMTLAYDAPPGRNFALDSFPDQQHDPRTDHADFMNIASKEVLDLAADCINSGRNC